MTDALYNKYKKRTNSNLQGLTMLTRAKFDKFFREVEKKYNVVLVLYSGYRSMLDQWDLRQKYLNGGALAAAPGSSYHNYMLAGDVAILNKDGSFNYNISDKVGKEGERVGLTWGKSFGDSPHFQNSTGTSISALKRGNQEVGKYKLLEQNLNKPSKPDKKNKGVKIATAVILLGILVYGISKLRK